jgi:hypothetical protein
MMSKGYLIFAQNNKTDDYIKMAYILALSLKVTQTEIQNVSLVTDVVDAVPNHYKNIFDHVIAVPWNDDSWFSDWKIENRWKLYLVSPYEETVILDSDMIFLTDISHWWNYLHKHHDMCFVTKSLTYRNELSDDSYYRKTFIENNLPNVYSAFFYFKKTQNVADFWDTVKTIVANWKEFYIKFLPNSTPKHLSMDVVFALAVKLHDLENEISSNFDYPTFVHMKSHNQNWHNPPDKWRKQVGAYLDKKGFLKIGNHQQSGIFHYTEKEFLTDHVIKTFETLYWEKTHV